ncbi:HNH endonuclease [Arthrobacter sp. H14-L1]|uniref:HNH endonuclease n=1 Tax=Arthrobacter sp. H14-L1 TaxID=2996697 RepID=UPI003B63D004
MFREQVTCKGCGTEFEAHHPSRTYCCGQCSVYFSMVSSGPLMSTDFAICPHCKEALSPGAYEAGTSRAEFVKNHEACRKAALDLGGRPDDCRCRECKARKGITTVLSVPPSARKRGTGRHTKHRQFVLDRDRYVCQICGLPTDPQARPSDDLYPTLDHISSIALYGGDDEPDNLRTAHRWCNSMLGDDGFSREELVRESALVRFG